MLRMNSEGMKTGKSEVITIGKNGRSLSASLKWILAGIVLVIVISFFISIAIINNNERKSYAMASSENVLRTLSNRISSEMNNYKELTRIIMIDDRLLTFLRSEAYKVDTGMINDARYGVLDILYVTEGVDSVMIFRNDMIMMATNRFFYNYDYKFMNDDSWKKEILDRRGGATFSMNSFGIASRSDNKPVLTIGREINDLLSQKRTGIMIMNISQDVFISMLNELDLDDSVCIMGTDGTYLAGERKLMAFYDEKIPEKDSIITYESGSQGKIVRGCRVDLLPIIIVSATDYGPEGIPYGIVNTLIILMAVLVASAAFYGAYIRSRITKPVFELSKKIDQNEQSGSLVKIEDDMVYSELNMVKDSYNNMIEHVNELITTVIEKEKTVQRMEMRVLQEQIKPHFLYNSLETIGYLAMEAKADEVHDALETLGSFYRNFLSKGSREITLEREINIVKDYIALQKLRYGDIIDDVYDIDDAAAVYIVPKLILQPLVENSIYHGIRVKGERGTIGIKGRVEHGRLHLIVRDTGVGMSEETISSILNKRADYTDARIDGNKSGSFGLWDTIERIRIYSGHDDVVKITSEMGEFTQIEFIIWKTIE
ncbi:MAG: histidine kinase [Lachnospiraceae bacterium]|nr:histidine kinase [Lachnospiraceae bacterium]